MPLGTYHVITGRLRATDDGCYIQPDEGGYWELLYPNSAPLPIGERITVEGFRVGFNMLEVEIVRPAQAGDWRVWDGNRWAKLLYRMIGKRWPTPDERRWKGIYW